MAVLNFITTNRSKIRSLQGALDGYDVEVKTRGLDLLEPQYDTVNEVSAFKARQAFERLREPVLVEDGGFVAEALNGFPGVYTKYALATIGAKGILNLLSGESNRRARFISCASYIDDCSWPRVPVPGESAACLPRLLPVSLPLWSRACAQVRSRNNSCKGSI